MGKQTRAFLLMGYYNNWFKYKSYLTKDYLILKE